jgi:hypothetical protein
MRKAITEFLSSDTDVWQQITKSCKASKGRRDVAVAFLGSRGGGLLPLSKGDLLVVNLSEGCLKAGLTDPREIRKYIKRDVSVYCCPDVHSKVFVFDNLAIVGSTNVSVSSAERLREAAIRTSVPAAVEEARSYVRSLAEDRGYMVTQAHMAKYEKLYRRPRWNPGNPSGPSNSLMEDWSDQVMKRLGRKYRKRHGYYVDLSNCGDAIASAHLRPPKRTNTGVQSITLNMYPGNDVAQARFLYPKLNSAKLLGLEDKGWTVEADMHFGHIQQNLAPYVYNPPLGLPAYITYWKSHLDGIVQVNRADFRTLGRKLHTARLLSKKELEEYEQCIRHEYKAYSTLSLRPGLRLTHQWTFATKVPNQDKFARTVRLKIDEALKTWGERWEKVTG